MIYRSITLIFLLCTVGLIGQSVDNSQESEYIIEEFVLPGGTTTNNVNCIVEGPRGFLWFGTHGGVIRYDGYEFITYKNEIADTIAPTTSLTFPYTEHLYWDKEDILWVSTYGGGLFRFDPMTETFENFDYDDDDSASISNSRVTYGGEDAEGRLWFTTEHGINRFDRATETFTRYYPFDGPDNVVDNGYRRVYLDKQGTLWFTGGNAPWNPYRSGLLKYNPVQDAFIKYVHEEEDPATPSTTSPRGLLEDSHGNFWVGYNDGLFKMDRERETFKYFGHSDTLPYSPRFSNGQSDIAFSLIEDMDGHLWVGSLSDSDKPSNLLRYNPNNNSILNLPLKQSAWQIYQTKDGTIWVAGAGISGQVSRIKPTTKKYSLTKGNIYEVAYNKVRNQINRGSKPLSKDFLSGLSPTAIGVDEQTGFIWGTHVGHYIGGLATTFLSSYNPANGKVKFYHLPTLNNNRDPSLPGNVFGCVGIEIDKSGKVWGSMESEHIGLFSFDPKTKKVEQYYHDPQDSTTISSNFIVDIFLDQANNDLYLGTHRAGLNRFDLDTKENVRISVIHPEYNSFSNTICATEKDNDGYIWISGSIRHKGVHHLVRLDPKDNSLAFFPIPRIPSTIRAIDDLAYYSKENKLAIMPSNYGLGVFYPSTQIIYLFNAPSGFNTIIDAANKILYDSEGNLWASTDEGKYLRLNKSGILDIIEKYNVFGGYSRDGVKASDGKLYFNTDGPWDVIDPSLIEYQQSGATANIKIVDLYVLGEKQISGSGNILNQPIWMMDEIQLNHKAQNFAFRFTDFNFSGGNSTYQYRLHPYEENWNRTEYNPLASYSDVPPGTYKFQVQSQDTSNEQNGEEINISVIISPPWWRTWWAYLSFALMAALLLQQIIKSQRDRAIRIERERNREKELAQAKEIEKAYNDLKSTQAQLIQSEKMASLGELTAGIAHEIQNPLNFVNNFSDVSGELIEEAITELNESLIGEDKGDGTPLGMGERGNNEVLVKKESLDEAKEILSDLKGNLEKIAHHGVRASNIVKSMLDHSRASSDEKVPTDINALCDEYLRLSYHGLRAKDKTFNSEFKTDFDENLPLIDVVPQDIGRVILNIINNAFYAVNERAKANARPMSPKGGQALKKSAGLSASGGAGGANGEYKPLVSISTQQLDSSTTITITDNGIGMSQETIDKVFQPFFTTKPTGSGTGLGMSISYDIITKGHGGNLNVKSKEGEGSEFIIELRN